MRSTGLFSFSLYDHNDCAISSILNTSIKSPTSKSLNSFILIPHSVPDFTSLASFFSLFRLRISPSSVLIDKNIFEEIGFFNENLVVCEDYELWLRICDKYEVFFIDEPLIIKHGGHQGQLSYSIDSIEYHRIKALEYLLSTGLSKENRDYAIQMLISKISIYLNGLKKRGKKHEIAVYEEKIKVWNKFSIESVSYTHLTLPTKA